MKMKHLPEVFASNRLNASGGSEAAMAARTRVNWFKLWKCKQLHGTKSLVKLKEKIY